jgi:hypothetical protein
MKVIQDSGDVNALKKSFHHRWWVIVLEVVAIWLFVVLLVHGPLTEGYRLQPRNTTNSVGYIGPFLIPHKCTLNLVTVGGAPPSSSQTVTLTSNFGLTGPRRIDGPVAVDGQAFVIKMENAEKAESLVNVKCSPITQTIVDFVRGWVGI